MYSTCLTVIITLSEYDLILIRENKLLCMGQHLTWNMALDELILEHCCACKHAHYLPWSESVDELMKLTSSPTQTM